MKKERNSKIAMIFVVSFGIAFGVKAYNITNTSPLLISNLRALHHQQINENFKFECDEAPSENTV